MPTRAIFFLTFLLAACRAVAATPTAPPVTDSAPPPIRPTETSQPAAANPTPVGPEATSTQPAPPAGEPDKRPVADADVTFVRAIRGADGRWTFHVTVQHPDTGWEDYADGWDVLLLDGTVLKPDPDSPFTRLLLHPHVNEQPFTRSQSGILIPDGEAAVIVRAHDLVDGFGGAVIQVDLTATSGPGYEVGQ